ncbi:MAG: hypothetical protein ACRDIE_27005 [Chloroflexota bacterium]
MISETEYPESSQSGSAPDGGAGSGDQATVENPTGGAGATRAGGTDPRPPNKAKGALRDAIPSPDLGLTPADEDDGAPSGWRNASTPADEDDGTPGGWRN